MNKKFAFILALLVTLLIASNYSFFKLTGNQVKSERESVYLSRVIDGDTIEIEGNRRIRLLNINAPEKNVKGSELAKDFLKNYENDTIEVEITGIDKYDRELARIYKNGYLNLELVKQGFSSKFLVQEEELNIFDEAEKFAILNSEGIWSKSANYGCFTSEIKEKEEYVVLINNCESLNINNWTLKDESRKTYLFKNIQLGKLVLHSSQGKSNATDIFWNSNTDIWNNDRDSLYLFDSQQKIAYSQSYGYN